MKKQSHTPELKDFFRYLALLLILGAIVFLIYKLIPFFFAVQEDIEEPPIVTEGSFGDSFSGVGWLDVEKTTAWHDLKTQTLTLPPKYEWRAIKDIASPAGLAIFKVEITNFKKGGDEWLLTGAKGEIFVMEGLRKSRETYEVQNITNIPSPETAGYNLLGLDYLPETDRWMILGTKDNMGKIWFFNQKTAQRAVLESPNTVRKSDSGLPSKKNINKPPAVVNYFSVDNTKAVEVGRFAPPDSWMVSQSPHYVTPTASLFYNVLAAEPILREIAEFEVKGDIDIACLKDKCLLQNGNALSFLKLENQEVKEVKLHKEVSLPLVPYSISIGRVSSSWLIGVVWEGNLDQYGKAQYKGNIYKIDANDIVSPAGLAMSKLLEEDLTSPYMGFFSFSGEDDDWLAVYGAYEGQALRFTAVNCQPSTANCQLKTENYSDFFNIRVMEEQGFKPQILKTGGAWYIAARDKTAKFLKIESQTALDFTNSLLKDYKRNILAEGLDDKSVMVASADKSGSTRIFLFLNQGFDQSQKRSVYSKSINRGSAIWSAAVSRFSGNPEGLKLYLSADGGGKWKEAKMGEKVFFREAGNDLRWRAVLKPGEDRFSAPSLKQIQITYEIIPK